MRLISHVVLPQEGGAGGVAEPQLGHLLAPQHQAQVKVQRGAGRLPQRRVQARTHAAWREEGAEGGQVHRPQPHAEAPLRIPHALSRHRVDTQAGEADRARARSGEAGALAGRDGQPAPVELLHLAGERRQRRGQAAQRARRAHAAAQPPRQPQQRPVRLGGAGGLRIQPQPQERGQEAADRVAEALRTLLEADGQARPGPRAVEQADRAVIEQIEELGHRRVARPPTLHHRLRVVVGQHA